MRLREVLARLQEIRAQAEAASPGPWRAHSREDIRATDPSAYKPDDWHGYAWVGYGGEPDGRFQGMVANLDRRKDGSSAWREAAEQDARFCAAARTYVPDMAEALAEAGALLQLADQAMAQAWSAFGDRLLARGPLSKEYAHAASSKLDEARRRIREALGK